MTAARTADVRLRPARAPDAAAVAEIRPSTFPPVRRLYERRACVAVEATDGAGSEEGQPGVRYAWRYDPG